MMPRLMQVDELNSPRADDATARVSVVVASYNHASFIERTLRSIFAQTRAPAELLVIDDGSRDDSPHLVAQMLEHCPFPCELIARGNRGLPATLNEGLERTAAATGDYFAYLGSDDVWLPGFLAARTALLDARPQAVLAYGHAYTIDAQDRITGCTRDWAHFADGDAREMLWQATAPFSPTVVYRRHALARERWYEAAPLEDYDLYLRLAAAGEFAFDPRALSAWRQHAANTSRDLARMLDEQLAAQRRVAPLVGVNDDELAWRQTALRWRRAEDLARAGDKRRAFALARGNWRGAASTASGALMLARLVVPHRFVERRHRRREQHAQARYGSLVAVPRAGEK